MQPWEAIVGRCISTAALFVLMSHCLVFAEATAPAVKAFEEKVVKARPLDPDSVRLVGGPLKQAAGTPSKAGS
jgi:hypothetical protein